MIPIWLRRSVILLVALGVFLRFYQLDYKVYWVDETYTSLRVSGYTREEFVEEVVTGKVVGVETLQHYQYPAIGKDLTDTLKSIAVEDPHNAPLYFVLARLWLQGLGNSITVIRSLSAVISLLAFPCLWWLCRELFASSFPAPNLPGWIAIALFAVTPLHLLYAQEARYYSLWTVLTLLSSAVLLWAIRKQSRLSWATYGLTVALGLYTHLLFITVAIAHGLYIAITEIAMPQRRQPWRLSKTTLSYLLATAAAGLAFVPWLIMIAPGLQQVGDDNDFATEAHSRVELLDRWLLNLNRVFFGNELYSANFVLALLVVVALYFLCRNAPTRTWLFILLLVSVPFLIFAVPDVVVGGGRSLRLRYLIPSYMAIQIALAYLFASQAVWAKSWKKKVWRLGFITVVVSSLIGCVAISQAQIWWTKGIGRCAYYIPVADLINQATKPLVIGTRDPIEILGLSDRLDPDVKLQLVREPQQFTISKGFDAVFLISPSLPLQKSLRHQHYRLQLLYEEPNTDDVNRDRLWKVEKG